MLRRLFSRCVRGCAHPSFVQAITGGLIAICMATVCQQVVVLLGTSLPVSFALTIALIGGIAAGIARRSRSSSTSTFEAALWQLALTAWMVGTPWWLQVADWIAARPGLMEPSDGLRNFWIALGVCCVLVGIPAAICARLTTRCSIDADTEDEIGWLLLGTASGLTAWGFGLAQVFGPWFCGIGAATFGLSLSVWRLLRQGDDAQSEADPSTVRNSHAITPSNYSSSGSRVWKALCDGLLALGCGGLLAATTRVLEQLLPGTIYLVCAEVIGVLVGLGFGLQFAQSRLARRLPMERRKLMACVALAVCCALLPVAFPLFVRAGLWLNAMISSPALLLVARGLMAGLVTLPIGLTAAICLAGDGAPVAGSSHGRVRRWLICGTVGYGLIVPAGVWGLSPEDALVGLALWTVVVAVAQFGLWPALPDSRLGRAACAACIVVVAAAPLWRERYDVRLSSRLLFNTNVFVGYRTGYGATILPSLDEGRHVATIPGARGVWTAWKYGGRQLQFRENGMPGGVLSCDPRVFPRVLPETLQAALPMVLHDKPQSLLLLGLGSGESLFTGLSFPLPEIVCWEADAARARMIREVVAAHAGVNPLADDRVRLTIADPILALDAESRTFDAIVSSPDHVALLRAQPCFTQSFYRRVARRLTPTGVFCQRLQFIDLGPRPLQSIVRTMQSAFRDVLAVEVAPGEMLLTATNDPQGLLQPKLTERLQLPHVRTLLAESGIDWTVILNLTSYQNDALAAFAAQGARRPNMADNSRLTFSMPREVMRWAPKLQEVQTAMSPHAGRMLGWIGEEGNSPVLLRRLSEVAGQHALMARYADQYWSYRATLRTHLTEKPRSKIQQASASSESKEMHPEDKRRLKYFSALGRATKTRTRYDIEFLERFEAPYDPLLSYFIHLEAAELYAQSDERDVRQELRNRLHAVWFSSPRDASLRNVAAALALLRESPEAEPDAVCRWDTLNALLQALQQRWDARAGVVPTNISEVIEDLDLSVLAAERTFEAMDEITREAGLPAELWAARRNALEKTLIRPIKAYRSEMLPHLHRKAAKSHADEEAKDVTVIDEQAATDAPVKPAAVEQQATERDARVESP